MKIFISYARKDKKLCAGFRAALAPLARIHGVEAWHDDQILPGGAFEDDISQALETADAVALLVSNHFFASDYCYGIEMTRALARHDAGDCVVAPVIVDFTAWKGAPFAHLNVVPADGKCVRDFKPQSKGWKEVAEGFIRLLPKRPPKPPAALHHLPIPHNPLFTGRKADLKWIADTLATGRPAALLHGMGGVGKTQTAAEYARRHADKYKVAWWVAAQTATEADAGYGALAEALRLPGYNPRDAEQTRQAVRDWMARESSWLVVLDNAESPKDAAPWLPCAPKGHLLITSRNGNWKNHAAVHDLDVWPPAPAADFLLTRSGDKDRQAAEKLAEQLGGLPLACETAAAYVAETGGSLARYADQLAKQPVKPLDFSPQDKIYARSLPQVVHLATEAVEGESPLAPAILRTLAWLAPDNIPRWLLDKWPAEPMAVDAALAVLLRRALLRKSGDGFSLHRLTQQIIRAADPQPLVSAAAAIRLLDGAVIGNPQCDVHLWQRYAALLPQGEALFALLPESPPEIFFVSRLYNSLGEYLQYAAGNYMFAESMFGKSRTFAEKISKQYPINLSIILSNQADLLRRVGKIKEARQSIMLSLQINEYFLHSHSPITARSLSILGIIYRIEGMLVDSEICHLRSMDITKKHYGENHPLVATNLNNISFILRDRGYFKRAREYLEKSLDIVIKHPERGAEHPETGRRHHNLGTYLFEQQDAKAAEPHLVRALEIREKCLHPNHPYIAETRKWLAIVRAALGKGDGEGEK